MSKVYLSPEEFQGQIDSFQDGASKIKELKYDLEAQGLKLKSVDKYIECIEEFNKTVALFGEMLDLDTQSMKLIKAKWMNTDSDIATKTLKELIFG
ncbi:hypothetical protein ACPWSR_03980 [Alloiococcus sp. CFN-8]|uniref:hypothetical protein n=1 Tax=Alloiococcus sp. CFN-8 TaxID=3416081 RepID=UPI003CEAD14B